MVRSITLELFNLAKFNLAKEVKALDVLLAKKILEL